MALAWENDAVKAAGKKWQEAQRRGDQAGMAAAAEEASRLRGESGYHLDGGQSGSRPAITDDSKWYGSGTNKVYQQKNGLGGSPDVDTNRNDQLQRYGNAAAGYGGGTTAYGGAASRGNGFDAIDYQKKAYQDMLEQLEAKNRLAVEQGVRRLEANRGTMNQGYDEAARQAYIAKLQSLQQMPQALAAQGLNGGASESARLALDASYGNSINANELARRNALAELDQSIADLRSTGDLSLAEQRLALQQQQLADLQNAYAQKVQQDNWQTQWERAEKQQELENYMNTVGAYYDDYTAEINRLLAMGVPEDDMKIRILKQARAEKTANQKAAEAEAAAQRQAYENLAAQQQWTNEAAGGNQRINRQYYLTDSEGDGGRDTAAAGDMLSQLAAQARQGLIRPEYLERDSYAFIHYFGIDNYKALLQIANENYTGAPVIIEFRKKGKSSRKKIT